MTDEAEEGEWTIDEATERFHVQHERNVWRTAFKEGVNLDEKILEGIASNETPEEYVDYVARYDLAFLTPCGSQIRFKVRSNWPFPSCFNLSIKARLGAKPFACE